MGQQQLLLLVLGIVIVGLSDAQAWKLKPAAFGGGAAETGFENLTLAQVGYEVGDNDSTPHTAGADEYENLNGIFSVSATTTDLTITGTSYEKDGSTVLNTVVVNVTGTESDQITTEINPTTTGGTGG